MAGKSGDDSKDSKLGNREYFDSFDRLQKVDQKDLNVDKLKATDKDADSEELLATKDKTHYDSNTEETGEVKFTNTTFELDDHKTKHADIETIAESSNTNSSQQNNNTIVPNTPLDNTLNLNNTTQETNQLFNINNAEANYSWCF
ncbi:MAG: hypothetical protein AB8B68_03515 [Rickettsiaceae bacterium]